MKEKEVFEPEKLDFGEAVEKRLYHKPQQRR